MKDYLELLSVGALRACSDLTGKYLLKFEYDFRY